MSNWLTFVCQKHDYYYFTRKPEYIVNTSMYIMYSWMLPFILLAAYQRTRNGAFTRITPSLPFSCHSNNKRSHLLSVSPQICLYPHFDYGQMCVHIINTQHKHHLADCLVVHGIPLEDPIQSTHVAAHKWGRDALSRGIKIVHDFQRKLRKLIKR